MVTKSNGSKSKASQFTVPGLEPAEGERVADLLQDRLTTLIDLSLTLKHVHWNVVGPYFIGVHQMIDPQVDAVREMVDDIAERIATLGRQPNGLPGFVAKNRSWDDYSIGRATVPEHLGALDVVYHGVIADHRKAIETLDDLDLVSQDMLVGQAGVLEQFHWFIRAHLENAEGSLSTKGADHELAAARKAKAGAES
jgi:starvation-inducible DNA-binding protein